MAKGYMNLDIREPTATHHFSKMLLEKNMVSYYLTENIDNLESKAGFKKSDVIYAAGGNYNAICAMCGK